LESASTWYSFISTGPIDAFLARFDVRFDEFPDFRTVVDWILAELEDPVVDEYAFLLVDLAVDVSTKFSVKPSLLAKFIGSTRSDISKTFFK